MIFGGKAEGVFEVEIASGDGRGVDSTGDRAEGSVVVVSSDAIPRFKMDEFRDVLVPVKGVEEFVIAGIGDHKERACGYRFDRVPNEEINLRIVVQRVQLLHTEVIVVDKLMMRNHLTIHLFLVENAAPHAVKIHRNDCTTTLPTHRAVLSIVGHRTNALKPFNRRIP